MKKNNEILKKAFILADIEDFRTLPDDFEKWTPSCDFEAKMSRLIRKRRSTLWEYTNTVGKRVAIVFLAFALLFGSAMSVKAIRDPVVEFIVKITSPKADVENPYAHNYYQKHYEVFYSIDGNFLIWCKQNGYIPEKVDLYAMQSNYVFLFRQTEDGNTVALMDYYGIPKEAYIAYWNEKLAAAEKIDAEAREEFKKTHETELNFDAWFSHDTIPSENGALIDAEYVYDDPKSVFIRCETDMVHTNRYYTINGFLIKYVGEDKFNEFKEKFAGTEDFNILNFIDYFGITKKQFNGVYYGNIDFHSIAFPYKSDLLYGTKELQDAYLLRHTIAEYETASEGESTPPETIPTLDTDASYTKQYDDGMIPENHEGLKYDEIFGIIDTLFLDWCKQNGFLPENADIDVIFDEYRVLFGVKLTEDLTTAALMDYYGIPKEAYITYWNEKLCAAAAEGDEALERFKDNNKIWLNFDAWFSDDTIPADQDAFIRQTYKFDDPKSVFIRCETDTLHTNRYYTINGFLIKYVGEDKFNEFKEKFAGTKEFNIFNFIEYFGITQKQFDNIYKNEDYHNLALPYKSEYLYGVKELRDVYFLRHPFAEAE